jgi:putative serine protease PepD
VATATGAALLASTLTAGVTWSLDNGARTHPSAAPTASPEAEPAVVPASSTTTQPDWQAVADAVRPSVVAIAVQTAAGSGEGSGVIIDTAGHVLTNDHVAGSAEQLKVTLADGRVFDATLVGADPTTDLAVIALTNAPDDLVPATLGDSGAAAVGQAVMAVGNPLGLDSTVTTGIISALDRPVSTGSLTGAEPVVTNAIQVDAAINPGNSGGPLFDASGRVIGITSSIASLSQGGSAGSIGLGFAIPANLAKRIADELITDGVAQHAFLGVSMSDGTATLGDTTRLGAVVQEVSDGSPAADAGLRAGDVVVAIDKQAVSGALSLTASVRELAAGDHVGLTVVRDGKSLEISVTLAARQESAKAQPRQGG